MIQTENFIGAKVLCDLCGREFDAFELECQSRTGSFLCPECMDEEENCGCADD